MSYSQGVKKTVVRMKQFAELIVEIGPRLNLLGFAQFSEKMFAVMRDPVDAIEYRREDGRSLRMTTLHRGYQVLERWNEVKTRGHLGSQERL